MRWEVRLKGLNMDGSDGFVTSTKEPEMIEEPRVNGDLSLYLRLSGGRKIPYRMAGDVNTPFNIVGYTSTRVNS